MQIQLQQLQNINFIILYNTKTDYSNLWMALLKQRYPLCRGTSWSDRNHKSWLQTSWGPV